MLLMDYRTEPSWTAPLQLVTAFLKWFVDIDTEIPIVTRSVSEAFHVTHFLAHASGYYWPQSGAVQLVRWKLSPYKPCIDRCWHHAWNEPQFFWNGQSVLSAEPI